MQDELRSYYRLVRKPRPLHSVDKQHQFLGGMGDVHIVVLTLCSFFSKVGGEGGVPNADVLGGRSKGQNSDILLKGDLRNWTRKQYFAHSKGSTTNFRL